MSTNKFNGLKFSELIIQLTENWIMWMKHNTISHDTNITIDIRKKSVDICETLINEEYMIIDELDKFYEKIIEKD